MESSEQQYLDGLKAFRAELEAMSDHELREWAVLKQKTGGITRKEMIVNALKGRATNDQKAFIDAYPGWSLSNEGIESVLDIIGEGETD